jgi:integrase
MGSVNAYETALGKRYRVRYRTPEHRQTDKRGFVTKRSAELFLASTEVAKARGEYVQPADSRETTAVLGAAWLGNQSHLKPSSALPLEIAWRLYVEPRWGRTKISEIRHSEVQKWITGLSEKRGATTVLRAYGVLAAILDVAVRDRRILTNDARGVKLPRKQKKEHVYLSHDQVSSLAVASGTHSTLVLTLAYCGLRWGEAVGLRVKDLDMVRRRINVTVNAVEVGSTIEVGTPKSHTKRSVPFPSLLTLALAAQCDGKQRDDLVFNGPSGGHLRRSHNNHGWFARAVRATGQPTMTVHSLRHTAASLAISSGANVKAVQRMLGHASASMTLDVYSDLFDDDLDAVAGRLDEGLAKTIVGKMWANKSSGAQ